MIFGFAFVSCGGDATTLTGECSDKLECRPRSDQDGVDFDQSPSVWRGTNGAGPASSSLNEAPGASVSEGDSHATLLSDGQLCPTVAPVIAKQWIEANQRSSLPIEQDAAGNLLPSPSEIGACSQCMSECSLEVQASCVDQDECVRRHCLCDGCSTAGGVEDFCECAATCMGESQQRCLEAWLEYGHCIASACVGVCP